MMEDMLEFLITRTWWTYNPKHDWYAQPYHWINLIEGCFWLVFAALVVHRHNTHCGGTERDGPRLRLEFVYAFVFLTFALSDFREAYVVQSWLILFKTINLVALLLIRRAVIRRYYPASKTF